MRLRLPSAALASAAAFLLCASTVHAWPHDPSINVPVCASPGDQWNPVTDADGSGGAFVAWYDWRSGNADVYVQHFDAWGRALWAAGGVRLCGATGDQVSVRIVYDGAGGAIAAWQDGRTAVSSVRAQRVDASGTPLWTADGVAMFSLLGSVAQTNPRLVRTTAGTCVITWEQGGNILAQKLGTTGGLLWGTGGLTICSATGTQQSPVLAYCATRGAEALYFAWRDDRNGGSDLYAQKVSTAGAVQWIANGTALCTAAGTQMNLSMLWDRTLGACFAWMDNRSGGYDIYVNRIADDGSFAWGTSGIPVCTAALDQWYPVLVSGTTGRLVVGWEDWRTGSADVYAQAIGSGGAVEWAANGVALCTATGNQVAATFDADGAGGIVGAWQDQRAGVASDVYAQRLGSTGVAQWAAGGVAVSIGFGDQTVPSLCTTTTGESVVAWMDQRGSDRDVYAQGADAHGLLGVAPVPAAIADVPNDQGGHVSLRWQASALDSFPEYAVARYRIYRRAPAQSAWALVDSVAAWGVPGYSRVLPTTTDSTGTSNLRTSFQVEAVGTDGWTWSSWADSGYSVDDLAPPAPAQFAGTYEGGVASLAWAASDVPDLGGYRLRRGSEAELAEGAGTLVTETSQTTTIDAAGAPFLYRLAVVDVHGNEGPGVVLLPDGTAGHGNGPPPREVALAPPAPNPLRGATALRYALPAPGRVRLAIHDAQGRCVRTLADGSGTPGIHAVAWEGRDDGGREVAPGVYFARLEACGRTQVVRLAVVR